MLNLFGARVRIDASQASEPGVVSGIIVTIVVAVVVGLVYALLGFLVEKIILPIMKVPKEKHDKHVLSKVVLIIGLLVGVVGLVTYILPAFGLDTGPLNLFKGVSF